MKIFIIGCLLFIHVNMCIFIRGFRISIRISGIRSGFGYPRVWFWWWISTRIGVRFGFGFGFQLRVSVLGAQRLYPIRTRPVTILSPRCSAAGRMGPASNLCGLPLVWVAILARYLYLFIFFLSCSLELIGPAHQPLVLFAWTYLPESASHSIVFFSHNKSVSVSALASAVQQCFYTYRIGWYVFLLHQNSINRLISLM
jgi:hypothetical protein